MCFRPASADVGSGANVCPECGKTIQVMGGIVLKNCPFCKCDFTPYLNGEKLFPKNAPGMPDAPAAPTAPKAPSSSDAPKAPRM